MPTKKPKPTTRTAIIVLGMHRTGTSAIGGVIAHLGATAPRSLMPPTPDNPKGYWESTAIMRFNDHLLESAGTRWSDWDKFNEEWFDSPLRDAFASQLSTILEEEYGDSPLILVKDPRICRMFPFWVSSLREGGIEPKVLIPLRHPSEVVGSLVARDHLAESQSKLIWLRHMLDAEYSSRGQTRAFVRYSDMLRDWHAQVQKISERLGVKWPRKSAATVAEIDAYLAPELRHHVAERAQSPEDEGIDAWVLAVDAAIGSLVDGGDEDEALRVLDGIRRDFDQSSAIYAPVVHEQRSQLEREISGLDASNGMLSGELETIRAAHEALKIENVTNYRLYDDARQRLEAMLERERNQGAATIAMISQHEITVAELSTKLDHVGWERAELVSKLDHTGLKKTEIAQLLDRAEQEKADLAARLDHSGSERAELARLLDQAEQGRADLAARLESIEQVRSELASGIEFAERERNGLEARLEACRRERAEMASRLEACGNERTEMASRLEACGNERTEMASRLEAAERKHAALEADAVQQGQRIQAEMEKACVRLNAEIRGLVAAGQEAEASLQERDSDIARLTSRVFDLESRAQAASAAAQETENRLQMHAAGLDAELNRAVGESRDLAARLQAATAEARALRKEVQAQAGQVADYRERLEGIQGSRTWRWANATKGAFGRRAAVAESTDDAIPDEQLLRKSGLFDRDWYYRRYPDVRARKMDAIRHYLHYGAREGRDPGPAFSTSGYRNRYPDVAASGVNPLVHYLKHGRKEGRVLSSGEE